MRRSDIQALKKDTQNIRLNTSQIWSVAFVLKTHENASVKTNKEENISETLLKYLKDYVKDSCSSLEAEKCCCAPVEP